MTSEEHIARLEHVTAGWIEQSRKDYEENRRLWREQQADIAAMRQETDRRWRETDERWREQQVEFAAMRQETDRRWRETDERFRRTDDRIDKLVTAIGELVRRLDLQHQ